MKKIITMEDLKALKRTNIQDDYFMLIYQTFQRFYKVLNAGEAIDKFSLEKLGYIVLLDVSDDLSFLPEVGLTQGLIKTTPEAVTKMALRDFSVYQIEIVCNNSFLLTVFISDKAADSAVVEWLENRL